MKDKKGYTLIEILATVIILGIIMGIATMAVSRFIKKGTDSYYHSLEEELKTAAAEYTNTYRTLLPRQIDNIKIIGIQELVDNDYIDEVKDKDGNLCSGNVIVQKYNQDSYKYYTYLDCGDNYKSDQKYAEYDEADNRYNDSDDYDIDLDSILDTEYYINFNIGLNKYEVSQGEEFIVPSAKVYKNGVLVNDKLLPVPQTVDTNTLGCTKLVYFYHGKKKEIEVCVVDKTKPVKPEIVLKYENKNNKDYKGEWYSGNIYASYKSTDYVKKGVSGSGIKEYQVSLDNENWRTIEGSSELITENGSYDIYVRSIDNVGNVSDVNKYHVKIDKIKPTCELEVKSGNLYSGYTYPLYNTNVSVGYKTMDGTLSNVVLSPITYTNSQGTNYKTNEKSKTEYMLLTKTHKDATVVGTVTDEAKNTNTCTITLTIDNMVPIIRPVLNPLSLGTQDYTFTSNLDITYGVSGGTVTCNPATSRKTGKYDVSCTAVPNNGLSSSQTTFQARHQYPALRHPKTCSRDCNCHTTTTSCNCHEVKHCRRYHCEDCGGKCCGVCDSGQTYYSTSCDTCSKRECDTCYYDCSTYSCPEGGTLNGTTCYYY